MSKVNNKYCLSQISTHLVYRVLSSTLTKVLTIKSNNKMTNKIIPCGLRVLVEIIEHENKTKGGIILPENKDKEIRSELVRVVAEGQNAYIDCFGEKAPPPGDMPYAIIRRNAGSLFKIGDKYHRLISSDEIEAVLDAQAAVQYCQDNFNFNLNIDKEND